MYLSDGFAVMPEQSTVAIVSHHPQSVYFGMKSGKIPEDKTPDELIAGTERGGELPPDEDPTEGAREEEAVPETAPPEEDPKIVSAGDARGRAAQYGHTERHRDSHSGNAHRDPTHRPESRPATEAP